MPITLFTAGVLGLLLLVLSGYVIAGRLKFKVDLGDGDNAQMEQRIRVHANFVEYVPLGLILLMLVEQGGIGPHWLPMAMSGALIVGRLLHAQGLAASSGATFGRFVGTNLTFLTLLAGSVAAIGRGMGAW